MNDQSALHEDVREAALTVRVGGPDDVEILAELIESAFHGEAGMDHDAARAEAAALIESGQTFVLGFMGGGLAAAAHVRIDGERGRLDFLAVSADVDVAEVQPRMVAIADSICVAYGCRTMEIGALVRGLQAVPPLPPRQRQ